jgi:3-phosphoshikimate 1-carboxyvinyltransferase
MSFATLGIKVPGISIEGAACVSKTCPSFFHLLKKLGE